MFHHVRHFKFRMIERIRNKVSLARKRLHDDLSRDPTNKELEAHVLCSSKLADKMFGVWVMLTEKGATTNTNNFDLSVNFDSDVLLLDFSSSEEDSDTDNVTDGEEDEEEEEEEEQEEQMDDENDDGREKQHPRHPAPLTLVDKSIVQAFEELEKVYEHQSHQQQKQASPIKHSARQVSPRKNPLTSDTTASGPAAVEWRCPSRSPQSESAVSRSCIIEIEDDDLLEKPLLPTPATKVAPARPPAVVPPPEPSSNMAS